VEGGLSAGVWGDGVWLGCWRDERNFGLVFVVLPGTFQALLSFVCVALGGCVAPVGRAIIDRRSERLNDRHGVWPDRSGPPHVIIAELTVVLQVLDEVWQIRQRL